MRLLLILLALLIANIAYAQEWRNMMQYKQVIGKQKLEPGHWLKSDRINNTATWREANKYNLIKQDCHRKYTNFAQKRDFYRWVDNTRKTKGHEVMWAGVAELVTKRMVPVDNKLVRMLFIRNKKFVSFVSQSNTLILQNICPDLDEMCNGIKPLKGEDARHWDSVIIYKEQCLVLDSLYKKQSKAVLKKFNRMANGKGIYSLVVPRAMRMNADIRDCENRCHYGLYTAVNYYKSKQD